MSRMKPWAWAGRYDDNAREVIRALSMGKSYRKFKGQHCQLAEQHKPTAPHNTFHNNRLGGGQLHHDVIAIWREGNLSCQYWVLLECDWPPLLYLLFFFTPSVIVTMNVCYVHHVVFRSPQSFIQRHLRISLTRHDSSDVEKRKDEIIKNKTRERERDEKESDSLSRKVTLLGWVVGYEGSGGVTRFTTQSRSPGSEGSQFLLS